MSKERPNLEYNLAGGLFLTLREEDFRTLIKELVSAGYEHACFLPFRALAGKNSIQKLRKMPLSIVHLEAAWNPTPYDFLPMAVLAGILGYGKRFLGDKTQPPIVQDALFPGQATCERLFDSLMKAFPQAKFISHTLDVQTPKERLLLEVSDALPLAAQEILKMSKENGVGLVFDPSHLLSSDRTVSLPTKPTEKPKGEWERQFNVFAPKLEVVDINPPQKSDVQDLLSGRGILAEVAAAAKEIPNIKFLRVEIPIPISKQTPFWSPTREKGFTFLREIGEALKSD